MSVKKTKKSSQSQSTRRKKKARRRRRSAIRIEPRFYGHLKEICLVAKLYERQKVAPKSIVKTRAGKLGCLVERHHLRLRELMGTVA
mmetsp:Transcript_1924/g.4015  ORF Transcript_1924/g.4015 Transcript_1924/m.4015 type:complete len:87 (-) Transcript_1924:116-376(-)